MNAQGRCLQKESTETADTQRVRLQAKEAVVKEVSNEEGPVSRRNFGGVKSELGA